MASLKQSGRAPHLKALRALAKRAAEPHRVRPDALDNRFGQQSHLDLHNSLVTSKN